MSYVLNEIHKNKIIAIIRGIDSDRIIDTVKALLDGGVKLLEITFNQKSDIEVLDTLKCLDLIKKEYGNKVVLGAGTVMTEKQVIMAVDAGAEYILSPNTDIKVIQKTKELGRVSIPGAFTPSEMADAFHAGADIVKFFPAGMLGVEFIKALLAPLNHIPVLAVGGINLDNADQFIKVGAKGIGVGGSLIDKKAIYSGNYHVIKQMAQAFVEKIKR